MISAWVSLGGGGQSSRSKVYKQLQSLRWRTLSAPALWVFVKTSALVIFWKLYNVLQSQLTLYPLLPHGKKYHGVFFTDFQHKQLYQNVKHFSKSGENFCKELITVFQQRWVKYSYGLHINVTHYRSYCLTQLMSIAATSSCFRAEMEHTYAKGLRKLAGKLIRASKEMSNK